MSINPEQIQFFFFFKVKIMKRFKNSNPFKFWIDDSDFDSLRVEFAQDGDGDCAAGDECHVVAGPDESREENRIGRRPEDVSVDLLPSIFIPEVSFLEELGPE